MTWLLWVGVVVCSVFFIVLQTYTIHHESSNAPLPRVSLMAGAQGTAAVIGRRPAESSNLTGISLELTPRAASLSSPLESDAPIEILWQRPVGNVSAVLLMLHGCSHQATDFWPTSSECSECLGLPEEVAITEAALARSVMPMAVTSVDRDSGCWSQQDVDRIEAAVDHVYRTEALSRQVPLWAFGASSGGAMVGTLTESVKIGHDVLSCRIPQIMTIPGKAEFHATASQNLSWRAPPTLFIHMPKDERTAGRVRESLRSLQAAGVLAAELLCDPMPVTAAFFTSRLRGVNKSQADVLVSALRSVGLIDDGGLIREDPRVSNDWRTAMMLSGVPEAIGDLLMPDASGLDALMSVAWASHAMCATHAELMLDFCKDPHESCQRSGLRCSKA